MIREAIERLAAGGKGAEISEQEAQAVALEIMDGVATPAQIGAFLSLLRVRGETVDCLVGFVRAMRVRMEAFPRPEGIERLMDTCGTGGDRAGTYNISTATAFVVAAAGVPVAKHGNKSVSSGCGSADVMAALGIDTAPPAEAAARALAEAGLCFLFAPKYHPAMRHAAGPRREIGIRTLFNLCGPLANPARPTHQLIGVPDAALMDLVAEAIARLGIEKALIVHGGDRLDEITLAAPTSAREVTADGGIRHKVIDPEDLDLLPMRTTELAGGSPEENARILEEEVLAGRPGPRTDAAALNAAAALWVAGEVSDLAEGLRRAREVLAAGRPLALLRKLRELLPAKAA